MEWSYSTLLHWILPHYSDRLFWFVLVAHRFGRCRVGRIVFSSSCGFSFFACGSHDSWNTAARPVFIMLRFFFVRFVKRLVVAMSSHLSRFMKYFLNELSVQDCLPGQSASQDPSCWHWLCSPSALMLIEVQVVGGLMCAGSIWGDNRWCWECYRCRVWSVSEGKKFLQRKNKCNSLRSEL